MSKAAVAQNIVSLDDYRRTRGGRATMQPRMHQTAPVSPATPAVWVYWVPVWVW